MSRCVVFLAIAMSAFAQNQPLGIGKPATPEEIARWNITVYPDGKGLPVGSGNAQLGAKIYADKCAECHNDKGEGRQAQYPALVGGRGTLATNSPVKTVGSYWPYATTLFDYIRRAMPYTHPRSLKVDEVYSVTAFVLFLNGIVDEKQDLNQNNLPSVQMPNRNGFVRSSK
jgi:S-disulfanyl-L-cysteine oxidoreductase SoxD